MIPVLTFRDPWYRDTIFCHHPCMSMQVNVARHWLGCREVVYESDIAKLEICYRLINKITKILFTTYEKKSRANLANM
jgi:hypothetical protein